ncbi:hypothetical protein A4A49_54229 [Nicotiana attenuata]|uniref:Uncharacterized protein n=1 Tax=Nicotiana attenuata TaxID=49451 RepID=A0A1J6IJ37_NICAT|nr:hypothetical protein A4A49_54229 [Nicotiana attenuata]
MSQGSSVSFGSRKNCNCGIATSQFTATPSVDAGRRFSKYAKTKEWGDDLLDPRIAEPISSLKCENDALKHEKIVLQMKVVELENILAMDVHEEDDND